jgi:septum formation inhibitor-activating ATPase MinD
MFDGVRVDDRGSLAKARFRKVAIRRFWAHSTPLQLGHIIRVEKIQLMLSKKLVVLVDERDRWIIATDSGEFLFTGFQEVIDIAAIYRDLFRV